MRQNVLWQSWVCRVEDKKHENVLSWQHFSKVETQMITRGSPLPSLQLVALVSAQGNNREHFMWPQPPLEHKMEMNSPTVRCLKGYDPRAVSRENRVICHIRISLFLLRVLHSV